jgi:hypothetical protein
MKRNLRLDRAIRLKTQGNSAAATSRFMRFINEQQDARHVVMLHGGRAHGQTEPDFLECGDVFIFGSWAVVCEAG